MPPSSINLMDCTLATIDNGVKHILGLEGTKDTVLYFIHSFYSIHFLPKQMETFYLLKNVASFLRPSAKDAAFLSLPVKILLTFSFVLLAFCCFHMDIQLI